MAKGLDSFKADEFMRVLHRNIGCKSRTGNGALI